MSASSSGPFLDQPFERATGRRSATGEEPWRAARVLVVDDDPTVLDVLDSILNELGYDVTACASARSALERFDEGVCYDLLLTDLGMPDMRGDELANRIRARCPDIPIVMLTGYYDAETSDAGWSVLTKPIRLASLDHAIRSAIGTGPTRLVSRADEDHAI